MNLHFTLGKIMEMCENLDGIDLNTAKITITKIRNHINRLLDSNKKIIKDI